MTETLIQSILVPRVCIHMHEMYIDMLEYLNVLIAHNLQGYIVQVSTLQKWTVQKNHYKMQTKTEKNRHN